MSILVRFHPANLTTAQYEHVTIGCGPVQRSLRQQVRRRGPRLAGAIGELTATASPGRAWRRLAALRLASGCA